MLNWNFLSYTKPTITQFARLRKKNLSGALSLCSWIYDFIVKIEIYLLILDTDSSNIQILCEKTINTENSAYVYEVSYFFIHQTMHRELEVLHPRKGVRHM